MNKTIDLKGASSEKLAHEAVKLLLEKKAENVCLYSVSEYTTVTDYYINATGRSTTQVASLADELADKLAEYGRAPERIEGKRGNTWILVDFADVIVNVFDRPTREFYDLDRHFGENTKMDITDLVKEVDRKFEINIKE